MIYIVVLPFLLLLIALGVSILIILIYFAFRGAPYVATDDQTLKDILSAARLKKGEKAVDLGSGDGKVVIALAKKGAEVHGFEFNPLLVMYSRYRIKKAGLQNNAFIHWGDFWRNDFSPYDVIIIYGITYIMKRLEEKLYKEVKPDARVITNNFHFPSWKPTRKLRGIAVYTK